MRRSIPATPPSPQIEESSGFSWFWVIVGIASVLVVLQYLGIFKTVDRERTVSVMDVRSSDYEKRSLPQHRLVKKDNPEVDRVMAEIKEEFETPIFTDIQTANANKDWGLTEDQAKFYDDMRMRYAATQENWLGVVRHASGIYKTVHDIFGTDNPSDVLNDARAAATVYARLQDFFGISAGKSLDFAQSNRATRLSDWANFVVSNMKRK
jgi:hypothetical protein